MLDPAICPFCGVDIHPYLSNSTSPQLSWVTWSRCVMGLKPSLYSCVQMQALAEEVIRGDHTNLNNPFHFDTVRLNLPGDTFYNPTPLPFVSKVVTSTGRIAGDLGTYVDDLRPVGSTKHHCQAVAHRISTILCYLGLQDALRKPKKNGSALVDTNTKCRRHWTRITYLISRC
jgi:hypothetical protein